MKRKIAMFSSTWFADYTSELIKGFQNRISNSDIELHIFNTYDATEKIDIIPKEQDILSLPCLDTYDGVLIAFNSVGDYPEVEKLAKQYAASGKPVLCIDQVFGGQPCIGVDNYHSFYQVIEHMITVHHCQTFNFLGGPENHPENRLRLQAFRDCLNAHGIPIENDRVLFFHFLHSDGQKAYDIWKSKGLHLPDAVICANDRMALGYCVSAENDGYTAPIDFRITGFDNLEEAQFYIPSITSVNRSWEKLGYESISRLLEMMDGAPIQDNYDIKGSLVTNESCGCYNPNSLSNTILLNYRNQRDRDALGIWTRKALQIFCNAESEDDIREGLEIADKRIGLPHLSLCLNYPLKSVTKESLLDGYADSFFTITARNTGTVTRTDLLPEELMNTGSRIFMFSPLHFGVHNFGYCVLPYVSNMLQYDKHRKFVDYLCLSMECTSQREMLKASNKQLENLYLLDQLTGLYNRFGYTDLAPAFFNKHCGKISIFYMDLDNLKQINDSHGHAMGDKSLCAIAEGIRTVFSEESLKIRMGGDEFLIIERLLTEREISLRKQSLIQFLSDYQYSENLPVCLSASIGHTQNEDPAANLEKLVRDADAKMYQIKQQKKQKL